MKYNDFQLPNEKTFNQMLEQYSNAISPNRNEFINTIMQQLSDNINYCLHTNNNYNKLILNTLKDSLKILQKIQENLSANFSTIPCTKNFVNEFNLFEFITNLLNTLTEFNKWLLLEEKFYYKKIITNQINSLLKIIYNLISSLKNSNIKLFKHM